MFVRRSKDNFQVLITLLFHQVGLGVRLWSSGLTANHFYHLRLSLYYPANPFCCIWGINLSNRKLTQTRQREEKTFRISRMGIEWSVTRTISSMDFETRNPECHKCHSAWEWGGKPALKAITTALVGSHTSHAPNPTCHREERRMGNNSTHPDFGSLRTDTFHFFLQPGQRMLRKSLLNQGLE